MGVCELCGRNGVETTVHHLLPKEMGGDIWIDSKIMYTLS
ncbi:hypothetical protein BAOM_2542 [Peribacillus asahii]|uniref:HNH endonuclease n=1 Tax=Peribacillus asahii TaxID=228899 RepID=A0A3T0KSG3_9BACI|nr:hypothetical protein BAOM_2542 [Peribacillus asahii]